MAFDSLGDFFSMGGHGLYVWLSYALGVGIIVGALLVPVLQGKQLRRALRRRFQREGEAQ